MNPVWPLGWRSAENGKARIEVAGTYGGHARMFSFDHFASARRKREEGIWMPKDRAVAELMTNSNAVDCCKRHQRAEFVSEEPSISAAVSGCQFIDTKCQQRS